MSAPLLEIRDATVLRDGRSILRIDELELRDGEHTAILGPNGAGKSTLIKLITRDVLPVWTPDSAVLMQGRDRWDLFEARKVFGVVSDDLQETYDLAVTVRDTVLSGFFGSIGLYRRDELSSAMIQRAEETIAFLGIERIAHRTMDTLSTGEARRALIGRALVHQPRALVLDEPCDGLDPSARHHFIETLRDIAQAGTTLVIVTHHIADIIPEVSRVLMLRDGLIARDGGKRELLTHEALSELFDIPAHIESRDGFYQLW
ncbi:MAG: ATP-binding cassette domain-containing protein [Actinomycetota bacterium]|nr:ATP-binding cassette domain-containing protein [Actinomycetota bacterium]